MRPDQLIRLCYVSVAALPSSDEPSGHIQNILSRSRWWNESVGITGSLFFNRTMFAQVLEGPWYQVERLFEQIAADPRHRNVIRIDWRLIEARQFPEWSMAFVGTEPSNRSLFSELVLDERRAADLARDAMLGLLVSLVGDREAGFHVPVETHCSERPSAVTIKPSLPHQTREPLA